MALILGALYMALGTMSLALAVFTAVPLALAGGIFAIALRGIPFSISAAVGFIANGFPAWSRAMWAAALWAFAYQERPHLGKNSVRPRGTRSFKFLLRWLYLRLIA